MIGKTISHYKILEKLGEGGMGVVYKAEDIKLKRTVALKFLPPELVRSVEWKERFVREAQAAAALEHPNICTTYEIDEVEGQTFIAMAYVDGQTLAERIESGPLHADKALAIAIQVAEGLHEAHWKGIVHRDIKSSNIMLTSTGNVRIMDFGLAKLEGKTRLTKTATIMGTVDYMSPEQARGETTIDQRSDIWSLGVVLYEMLTGKLPFKGQSEQAVIYSILNEKAENISELRGDVPPALEQAVDTMLEKNPQDRYADTEALIADLKSIQAEFVIRQKDAERLEEARSTSSRHVKLAIAAGIAVIACLCIGAILLLREPKKPGSAGTPPIAEEKAYSSIAVLPFADMSPDKDQEYFCDGMAETLINELTRIQDFKVIARTSAFSFKDQNLDVRDIGSKLNVETVLEGSVQKAGNTVRITAQLVDAANGHHLWSAKYDRDMRDIFAIQDELSQSIVRNLKVKLSGGESATRGGRPATDPEIYDLYLRGMWFWDKAGEENLKKALEYFEQAIERDPDYAPAYVGVAQAYLELPLYVSYPHEEAFQKAKEAVLKALEIDDTLADAQVALGKIKTNYEWDWDGAERAYMRAIELNPSSADAYHAYAECLMFLTRFDEAVEKIERAQELDPIPLWIRNTKARILSSAGHTDQAIEECRKILEMDPGRGFSRLTLAGCYMGKSMHEEALAEAQKAKGVSGPWEPIAEAATGMIYTRMGKRDEAEKILKRFEELSEQGHVVSFGSAVLCFELGENDKGFAWLEKAYEQRESWLQTLKIWPGLDSVRSDPRFIAMLKKVGLEK